MPGGAPIWYSGSPVQVDFGEAGAAKHVVLVEAAPGTPAQVREIPLAAGASLRTLTGTLDELRQIVAAEDLTGVWLRVRLTEPARAGLADDVRELLGERVVDVRVDARTDGADRPRAERAGRSPQELFGAFLEEQGVDDDRLTALFARLLDEELSR
jgi:exonuclease SbcD